MELETEEERGEMEELMKEEEAINGGKKREDCSEAHKCCLSEHSEMALGAPSETDYFVIPFMRFYTVCVRLSASVYSFPFP